MMRNILSWIVAAATLLCALPASAQEPDPANISFTVNVPMASEVNCRVLGQDHPLTDGDNAFTLTAGTSVNFAPKYPWRFSSIKNLSGKTPSGFSGKDWYLYVDEGVRDEVYTISMVNINDLRTEQFTLNVDDPSLVNATMTGYDTVLDLKPGANTIPFDPKAEEYLNLSPVDNNTPFYSVKLNGVSVAPQGLTYGIHIQKGCVVDVTAILPDEQRTVNLSFTDGARNAVSFIVNDSEQLQIDGNAIAVKVGDKLTIQGNPDYKINEVTVNGLPVAFYGTYSFYVMRNTEVHVDARPYASLSATLIINDPTLITVSSAGKELNLTAGDNLIQVPENNTTISWAVSPMGLLNSVRVNGGDALPVYQTSYAIQQGDVLVFDLTAKVFDMGAIVWVDNTAGKACSDFLGLNSVTDPAGRYSLKEGYNTLAFNLDMNPFTVYWHGTDPDDPNISLTGRVYVNGKELLDEDGTHNSSYIIELADGDVMKLFMDSNPMECAVSFDIADGVEASVVKDIITTVENPSEGFGCFAGTEVSVSGKGIRVSVNGHELSADADSDGRSVYTFTVEQAATSVAVTAGEDTGVDAMEAESDPDVYDMQGVKAGTKSDLPRLSPGIYIMEGRKITVK